MPKLTGSKYDAFKKTMNAANKSLRKKELASIRRTISDPLPGEGPKIVDSKTFVPGITASSKGGRSRRRKSRKKRRKRKTKRKKSRKKRRKSRRKRRR